MAAGGWWVVMFTLTHWPKLGEGGGFDLDIPHADKIAHFGLFCGWFLLWSWALGHLGWPRFRITATLLILGTVYAAIDESTQAFVPGRSPSLADFGADALGLVVGWGIVLGIHRSRRGQPEITETIT
jgi:VanZ family protein